MVKLSIVIVNYNTFIDLENCLNSLFKFEFSEDFEVIVVDNDSINNKHFIKLIGNFNGRVKYIVNQTNHGFSKACNIGFSFSTGKYILFLNPDILFTGSILDAINFKYVNIFKNNLGIFGINMVNEFGQSQYTYSNFTSPISYILRALGVKTLLNKFGVSLGDLKFSNKSQYVDQIIGAFFYLSRETFEKVGKFDERFFVYFEEMDFCFRAYKLNIHCFYENDILVIHKGAVTASYYKELSLYLNLKSRLLYFKKHFPFFIYLTIWFSTVIIEFFSRLLQSFFTFKLINIKIVINVYKKLFSEFLL